ncbi:MAG: alpha-ketoglutarate-dependent dioxygenase AlkB [Limisphaerales bacterium]
MNPSKEILERAVDVGGLRVQALPGGCAFLVGELPPDLVEGIRFEEVWDLHPADPPEIHLHGRRVRLPRWQQAYGVNYRFSGQVSRALPVPPVLQPLLDWCRAAMDPRLNGLLLNWYDGRLGHYIGRHRDSTRNVVPGSGVVTVSLGEERVFRLRPWPRSVHGAPIDFKTGNGTVFLLPWAANLAFTHEVIPSKRLTGRRISVTLRAFDERN